ncbi:RNA polymerase sigma-70 factor (ECF subfamily) [Humibacillus xanthopallidus]|uniref:RNA polymerase sigma factor n=1 Tax=Humibacillus xanthopallidus TaxID=412689 RepID=A0A543PUQ4_9MICO|nr:sigma-70 family RNA polymerase sigma factor [Humibacillus xanthopallidus]TQN47801.1 RNA polymerase sigma-70 factor (ECF subfamily) [Humibacillus xanthopallidus]
MDDDDDAVRAVYDLSYRRLVTQMVAMCGNRCEAEDVVQEAFLTAWTHRDDFAAAANKEAWLRTVSLNLLRHRWRRARLSARTLPKFRAELSIDLGAQAPENHVAVVYALSQLSLPVRVTAVLFYVADLTVAQISRELSAPEGTIKARLARARAQMAGHLSDREEADHV